MIRNIMQGFMICDAMANGYSSLDYDLISISAIQDSSHSTLPGVGNISTEYSFCLHTNDELSLAYICSVLYLLLLEVFEASEVPGGQLAEGVGGGGHEAAQSWWIARA